MHHYLMRLSAIVRPLIVLLGAGSPALVRAQNADLPSVTSLRPSAPPAFVLLGASPTDIARPQSFRDLSAIIGNRLEQFTTVPEDLAAEFTPYWLLSHPTLGWREDVSRDAFESIRRTLRLSIASAKTGDNNPVTSLAGGISVDLLSGEIPDTAQKILAAIEKSAAAQGTLFNRFRAVPLAQLDAALATRLAAIRMLPVSQQEAAVRQATAEHQAAREALDAAVRADPNYLEELTKLRDKFQDFAITRKGWFWNVQASAAWTFAANKWDNSEFAKWGIWTTFSYDGPSLSKDVSFNPLLVIRYLGGTSTDTLPDVMDVGARIIASAAKYAASVEYVLRSPVNNGDSQHRLVGLFEYQLSGDSWLQASFGKGMKQEGGMDLIARLGVTLSLAKERYKTE